MVAISGYYGCGNAGDEAILAGIRDSFLATGPPVRLLALSQDPAGTTALHGIPAAARMRPRELLAALRTADLVLSGGGSLYQDTTSIQSLVYYAGVARAAELMRRPVMLYAQGVGPLRRPLSRRLVASVARRASAITVRDLESARLLQSLSRSTPAPELVADPAFALDIPPRAELDALFAAESIPVGPLLGVSLRSWPPGAEDAARRGAQLVTELEASAGVPLLLIPMQQPADLEFAESILAALPAGRRPRLLRRRISPSLTLGVISRMAAMIAMRLHALIFAARAGVPLFGLSYDPKIGALLHSLDLQDCMLDWAEADPVEIAARTKSLLARSGAISTQLQCAYPQLRQQALRSAVKARELLRDRGFKAVI